MRDSPCNVWEAVAAGHVQGSPSVLVPLVDICSVMDQQLDALQVPRQDGLVDGSHTYKEEQGRLLEQRPCPWFGEQGSPEGERFPSPDR